MSDDEKNLDDKIDEPLDVVGCLTVGLVIGFIVFCVIMLFLWGPLFLIILLPILLLINIVFSIFGLAFGKKEDCWKFTIPLVICGSLLSAIVHSSFSSIFTEEDE